MEFDYEDQLAAEWAHKLLNDHGPTARNANDGIRHVIFDFMRNKHLTADYEMTTRRPDVTYSKVKFKNDFLTQEVRYFNLSFLHGLQFVRRQIKEGEKGYFLNTWINGNPQSSMFWTYTDAVNQRRAWLYK